MEKKYRTATPSLQKITIFFFHIFNLFCICQGWILQSTLHSHIKFLTFRKRARRAQVSISAPFHQRQQEADCLQTIKLTRRRCPSTSCPQASSSTKTVRSNGCCLHNTVCGILLFESTSNIPCKNIRDKSILLQIIFKHIVFL